MKTGAFGEVRVGLLDAAGNRIAGRGADDCIPITGDHLAAAVTWKDGTALGTHAANVVRLSVTLRNARVYAFRFAR